MSEEIEISETWQQTPSSPIEDIEALSRHEKARVEAEYARGAEERRKQRERPYPRRLLRTLSSPVYKPGEPPRLQVEFSSFFGNALLSDLLARAWKRDIHEIVTEQAAARRRAQKEE